jgi:transposase-like protein
MTKRTFTREFKLQVVRQLVRGEKRISQLCREHGLCHTLVSRWRTQFEKDGDQAWLSVGTSSEVPLADPERIAALESSLGRAHLEIDFLRHTVANLLKRGSPPANSTP